MALRSEIILKLLYGCACFCGLAGDDFPEVLWLLRGFFSVQSERLQHGFVMHREQDGFIL